MQDVPDHRAGGRGDDADDVRQERDRLLAGRLEQPFRGQAAPPLFQQPQQRALARQFQRVDDELILRAVGIGGQPSGRNHVQAVLRRDAEPVGGEPPADAVEAGVGILQREVQVTGRGALEAGNLAAHPNGIETLFDVAFQRLRQLADGEDGQVVAPGLDARIAAHESTMDEAGANGKTCWSIQERLG